MNKYVVLLRGINVGGKNGVAMAELRECLQRLGFENAMTYIASGNVLVTTDMHPATIKKLIEEELPRVFKLDSELVKVLVLTHEQLKDVINRKPKGFGDQPDKYHSVAIFLIDGSIDDAMSVFNPREGVDNVWAGKGVIYSQRLSAERTKSRLGKIIGTPIYQSMTIRSWNTVVKLLSLLDQKQ